MKTRAFLKYFVHGCRSTFWLNNLLSKKRLVPSFAQQSTHPYPYRPAQIRYKDRVIKNYADLYKSIPGKFPSSYLIKVSHSLPIKKSSHGVTSTKTTRKVRNFFIV